MKLTAIRQIFNKQLSEATHECETDISSFPCQIWNQQPLDCVNGVVNSTLKLIIKNVSSIMHTYGFIITSSSVTLLDWIKMLLRMYSCFLR